MHLMQGMGEGEGGKDISDQIENEDQLLGAKQQDASDEQVFTPPLSSPQHHHHHTSTNPIDIPSAIAMAVGI